MWLGPTAVTRRELIETSADGGNTWTTVPVDPSIAEVDTVAFNGTVWAATGGVTPEFDDVAIRSADGVTWTLIRNIGKYSCAVLLTYDVVIATSAYNLYIYDDCCHLLSSFDLGVSWAFSFENVATLSDAYIDLSMAIADGDYTTMLSYDANYTYPDADKQPKRTTRPFQVGWPHRNVGVFQSRSCKKSAPRRQQLAHLAFRRAYKERANNDFDADHCDGRRC